MFPADRARPTLAAALIGALLVGLLPATALAVGPVADDDHLSVPVNAPATTLDVLDGDTGDTPLTIMLATDPANGTVLVAVDQLSVTYQPDLDFHGTDTFDYTVTDGDTTDVGTVTVDVNSAPVAVNDPGTACQDPAVLGGAFPVPEDFINPVPPPPGYFVWFGTCALLHNDTDVDGDTLTWEIVTQPANGDILKLDEEFFAYKPDADYSATDHGLPPTDFDTFTYRAHDGFAYSEPSTMRIWVAPVNDAPTFSEGAAQVTVGEDSGAYDAPWATAVSPGPSSESWQSVHFETDVDLNGAPNLFDVQPSLDASGRLTFTTAPDQVGLVHVTVRAKDDGGLEDWDLSGQVAPDDTSDDVTFDIVVSPDAIDAVDDVETLPEDPDPGPWLIDVLDNDTFPGGSTITSVTQGTLGLVTIAPDALSVWYQPDENAYGADTFTYTLDDGSGTVETATVDVTVTPVNDAPVADDDPLLIRANGPAKAVDVLAGDSDVEGDTLLVTATSPSLKGTVTITGGGTGVTYQPNTDETGSDSFTYTVSDGHGGTDEGTVSVTIAENGTPVADDDTLTVLEDDPATAADVLANDSDPDSDPLHITGTSTPTKGVVVITGGGTGLTYEPADDANGADSFTYTVNDGTGGTDTATVTVTITPANDDPTAGDDALTISEDAVATAVAVLTNDSDPDGDPRTIMAKTDGLKGVVAITGGGTGLTYKPNPNANGADSFTYTISDGHGETATATVTVTINPINDKPDARNDTTFTVPQGAGAVPLAVLTNDVDADGDASLITAKTDGAHGTVTITGGGTGLTYNPAGLYFGTDVFSYTINDGHGQTDTATVLLSVVRDTVKPLAAAPIETFPNHTTGTSTVKIRLNWGGSDTGGTGIASYKLQVSVNGGSYTTVTLSSAAATSSTRTLTLNRTYRFRVRAVDKQGNTGYYAYGPTFKALAVQNSNAAVAYVGSWPTSKNSKALGGSHRYTSVAGATATYTGSMREVGWIATKTSSSGSAEVWIDGTLAATVNLRSSSTGYRKLIFHRHFASTGTHTIQIKSLGGGRVYFDAFPVLR